MRKETRWAYPQQRGRRNGPKKGVTTAPRDDRFTVPLYTVADAARYLGVPRRTLGYWTQPRRHTPPVVTVLPEGGRGQPVMPFAALTEAYVAAAFRRVHGLSLPYIRKALTQIKAKLGLEFALASKHLYTDGAKILFDHRKHDEEAALLVEVVSDNVVFTEVVRDYLSRITYAADGWADQFILPTEKELVLVNPHRAYGQPLTIRGAARVIDLLDRFEGGENPHEIAEDFGVPEEDVLEVVRAFYRATPEAA
jgi:uncharacterized protein (DUF433 family)